MAAERWFVRRGEVESGPHDEAAVLAMIADGMREAVVRSEHEQGWRPLSSHAAFGRALRYAPPATAHVDNGDNRHSDVYGKMLLVLPAVGGVLLIFLGDRAGTALSFGIALGCGLIIAQDARRWGIAGGKYAVTTVLLWLVGYPWYLYARSKREAPNILPLGLAAMALFMGGAMAPAFAEIYVLCTVTQDGTAECQFDNQGLAPGRVCFSVVLKRHEMAVMGKRSEKLCTPFMWPGDKRDEPYPGAFVDPVGYCGQGSPDDWAEQCAVDIEFPDL